MAQVEGISTLLVTLIPYVSTSLMMRLGLRYLCCVIWFCWSFWCSATLASLFHQGSLAHFLPRAGLLILLSQYLLGTKGIISSFCGCVASFLLLSHAYVLPECIFIHLHMLHAVLERSLGTIFSFPAIPTDRQLNVYDARALLWESVISFTIVFMLQLLNEQAHRQAQKNIRESAVHKSEFIARMSHELRTPLFGIVGCLEMLHITKVDPQQNSLLQMAETCAKSLMALIDDILDMSKIEVGKMEFDVSVVDTTKLIDESLSVVWALANKKGIKLRQVRNAELPRFFQGDRVRNRQVLINLLSNSVKFTPTNGTISLHAKKVKTIDIPRHGDHWYSPALPVASTSGRPCDGYMAFKVKDTGIGLEPNEFARIFNPFEQADVSVARSFGGTGLGLTISASLVAQMGGRFFVSSHGKGKGATFQYFIPYFDPTPMTAAAPCSNPDAKPITDRRRLLLAASRLSMPVLPTQTLPREKTSLHAFIHSHINEMQPKQPERANITTTIEEEEEEPSESEKTPLSRSIASETPVKALKIKKRTQSAPPTARRVRKSASVGEIPVKSPLILRSHLRHTMTTSGSISTDNALNPILEEEIPVKLPIRRRHLKLSKSAHSASEPVPCLPSLDRLRSIPIIDPHESILEAATEPICEHSLRRSMPGSTDAAYSFVPASMTDDNIEIPSFAHSPRLAVSGPRKGGEKIECDSSSCSTSDAYRQHIESMVDEFMQESSCPSPFGSDNYRSKFVESPTPLHLARPLTLCENDLNDSCESFKPGEYFQIIHKNKKNKSTTSVPAVSSLNDLTQEFNGTRSFDGTLLGCSSTDAKEASEQPVKRVSPSSSSSPTVTHGNILVAEDNPINQRILELMLARLGYKCDLAANGLEVLKRIEERDYDLILMDIEMPELPGLEAAKRIREMGNTTPIVALSAHVFTEARQSAIDAGMDQFINKPINVDTLRKVLTRWIPEKS